MGRSEIATILRRHRGSIAEVARRSGVKANAVSMWLAGGPNANVARHAEAYAQELLRKEEATRTASGEANGPSARKFVEQFRKKSQEGL